MGSGERIRRGSVRTGYVLGAANQGWLRSRTPRMFSRQTGRADEGFVIRVLEKAWDGRTGLARKLELSLRFGAES